MAESVETGKWPDLSRPLVVLGWLGMMVFAFHACTHMVAAGDTWVAMACGRHFVNHGVDTIEPFSANSHKPGPTEAEVKTWPPWAQRITEKVGLDTVKYWHPTGWINQNWLTHVIFYWLSTTLGSEEDPHFNALVYLKFAIYIITVICVYYTARILGAHQILSAVFACFAMFVGRSFLDVRPAGFANLLVAVYLLILVLATYRSALYIWLIVPVIVFWCNVHGGYIYAFIMLVPFAGLHLFLSLPRRWTVSLYSIVLWAGLYVLAYKFLGHEHLQRGLFWQDRIFYLLLVLVAASLIITALKQLKSEVFYGYHIAALLLVFVCVFLKFLPATPLHLSEQARRTLREYVGSSQLAFIIQFLGLTAVGLVVTFAKNRLVCIKLKGICHTLAAGFAGFVAVLVFNPFHLTNLTHTFIISVSKHAERWRDVNEWHPAFEWTNLVGTSFPFLIMVILAVAAALLWLLARRLNPGLLKGSRDALSLQERRFGLLTRLFGYAAVVFSCWVVFVSCSLLNLGAADFFICAVFAAILLLSVRKNVHFIYLVIPLTLLVMYAARGSAGYAGRYFYPFVLLPSYVLCYIFASLFSRNVKTKPADIAFVGMAAVVALLLMIVLLDPFKFESAAGVNKFLSLQRIWRPKYELAGNTHLKLTYLFPVLYIVNVCSVLLWLALPFLRSIFRRLPNRIDIEQQAEPYRLPRIDLALMTIAALSIYMAVCSRRFIPIAAIAACPIIAVFVDQMSRTISAARSFHSRNRLSVGSVPYRLQVFLVVAGTAAVLSFGGWWGYKFWRVYLSAWPTDTKLNSVFMRMTASDAKPFSACKFIKINRLEGKMFNYWTEGGFIAYGQEPDPNTGRTPLRLFMDGRAQAAYDRDAYDVWGYIMGGGRTAERLLRNARLRKRKLTADDYAEIGRSIDKQLKQRNVWVVLMPWNRNTLDFIRYIEAHPDWQLVFFNRRQRLFVDITTPQGKELFDGILSGRTLYPDDFSRNLIMARNLSLFGKGPDEAKRALDFAFEAFKMDVAPEAMMEIIHIAKRSPQLRPRIYDFWRAYFDDFERNKDRYAKQHGYWHRLTIAINVVNRLRPAAKNANKTELEELYKTRIKEYDRQRQMLLKNKRW